MNGTGKPKVRVRFAPSPTGPLHMGGVRTALYNYLFAKKNGGTFILRIEDTDSHRFVPGAEEYIIESLRWCGIIPDEGVDENGNIVEVKSAGHPHAPYRQSQRKAIYRKYAEELVRKGAAYYAFDTPEELETARKECEKEGKTFIYSHETRMKFRNSFTMSGTDCEKELKESRHWTIRFNNPADRTVKMHDIIRGDMEVSTSTLDDKVLWKASDELPTYHLANIVDDHLMEITHVIRGEEWLPSLPLHYMLYESFGWQDTMPEFAHLSLLLKPDGKGKLSKRDGDRLGFPVFPLRWTSPSGEISRGYREDGYYPEAFVNMIAMLGWNPGTDRELFSMDELASEFSLNRVVKSGARFNPEKAVWFNQEYLRRRSDRSLAEEFMPYLKENGIEIPGDFTQEYVCRVIGLVKDRARFVSEFWGLSHFFFKAPVSYDKASAAKYWKTEAVAAVKEIAGILNNLASFGKEDIAEALHGYIESHGLGTGKVMNALRLAIVGESKGPGVADIMETIGRKETVSRLSGALENIIL